MTNAGTRRAGVCVSSAAAAAAAGGGLPLTVSLSVFASLLCFACVLSLCRFQLLFALLCIIASNA